MKQNLSRIKADGAHLQPPERQFREGRWAAAKSPPKLGSPMAKDALLVAQAKASRITGNKWNVKIDGATLSRWKPPDKAAAIEAAYALYAESFSDPSQGG